MLDRDRSRRNGGLGHASFQKYTSVIFITLFVWSAY
jgi:hypothetical protein